MSGCGSPCGACKFLRRKCVMGCVFAPYFCHEQGATHFAAIHKVFGASNVSKLLTHLPVSHRSEATITISYEAQARVHDPIYGCVSHIFSLQQQIVTLQAQLSYLKQEACQGFPPPRDQNPNNRIYPQDAQSWLNPNMVPPFHQYSPPSSLNQNVTSLAANYSFEGSCSQLSSSMAALEFDNDNSKWHYQVGADDLHSLAFGYKAQHS